MKRLPAASIANPLGCDNQALVAGPPSPGTKFLPPPATVAIVYPCPWHGTGRASAANATKIVANAARGHERRYLQVADIRMIISFMKTIFSYERQAARERCSVMREAYRREKLIGMDGQRHD